MTCANVFLLLLPIADGVAPESLVAPSSTMSEIDRSNSSRGCQGRSRHAAKPASLHRALCPFWSLIGLHSPGWIAGSGR